MKKENKWRNRKKTKGFPSVFSCFQNKITLGTHTHLHKDRTQIGLTTIIPKWKKREWERERKREIEMDKDRAKTRMLFNLVVASCIIVHAVQKRLKNRTNFI